MHYIHQQRRIGFTLVELLVVISIIGLLSTLAVVSLNSARLKARDAKRVADIKQLQTALELYFNDQQAYPIGSNLPIGSGAAECLNQAGFGSIGCTSPYMALVPTNPGPGGATYIYNSEGSVATYSITFGLEGTTGGLASGAHSATQDGFQ